MSKYAPSYLDLDAIWLNGLRRVSNMLTQETVGTESVGFGVGLTPLQYPEQTGLDLSLN